MKAWWSANFSWIIIVVALVALFAMAWIVFRMALAHVKFLARQSNDAAQNLPDSAGETLTAFYVAVLTALIGGLVIMAKVMLPDQQVESQIGYLVVIAVSVLVTLLFTIAAGFAHLRLTDATKPLGLPEGSVRSMIALILIMVFIIVGVYVFRVTGAGDQSGPVRMTKATADALSFSQLKEISAMEPVPGTTDVNVWHRVELSD